MFPIKILGVVICDGIVIDTVAELISERGGIGMIMMIRSCLVGITRVKCNTFIDVCVSVPSLLSTVITTCVVGARTTVGKSIPGVEHTYSVNH